MKFEYKNKYATIGDLDIFISKIHNLMTLIF